LSVSHFFGDTPSPIIIPILFHHYQELKECISEVEQIEEASRAANSSNSDSIKNIDWLTINEKEGEARKKTKEIPTAATLDNFFFS